EQHGGEQDHHDEHGAAAAGHPIFPPGGGLGRPMKGRNIAEPLEPREQSWSALECGSLLPLWGERGTGGFTDPRRPPQSGGKPPHSKAAKPPHFRVAWQYGTCHTRRMARRIGIDLGGTKIEGVVLDDAGESVARRRVPTDQQRGYGHIVETTGGLVDAL